MARPSKFNKIRREQILKALRIGATYTIAAESAGISLSCLSAWIQRGKKAATGQYAEFVEEVKLAEAQGAIHDLQVIHDQTANGNWKCAAWRLERRHGYQRTAVHERVSELPKVAKNEELGSVAAILRKQKTQLQQAISRAERSESWQAYAALQRQLLDVALREKALNEGDGSEFDGLSDHQLLSEISDMVAHLPPIHQQQLIDMLSATNVHMLSKKR